VNGTNLSGFESSPSNITFTLSNGTYVFTASSLRDYYTDRIAPKTPIRFFFPFSKFNLTVNGRNMKNSVHYDHWAYITGTFPTPAPVFVGHGASFLPTLSVNGIPINTKHGVFNVSVVSGTYHLVASECGYKTYYNNFTLGEGGMVNLSFHLKMLPDATPIRGKGSDTYIYVDMAIIIVNVIWTGTFIYMVYRKRRR
jgi:hypothetical protein